MASYYDTNKPTTANCKEFFLLGDEEQHFPIEGLYLGELLGGNVEIPALIDMQETKGFCLLYSNSEQRQIVNTCLERLVWRVALTVPSNLCDIILYNGGNPGVVFNMHLQMNKYLTENRENPVFFDGTNEAFGELLDETYASIVERMASVRCAGKQDLVELNESLGQDAQYKYKFIFVTDFPGNVSSEILNRLFQIVEVGNKAGIYVIMSWNMQADFKSSYNERFNPQEMLQTMELLFPRDNRFYFKNSGHDEVLNRFTLQLDSDVIDPLVVEKITRQIDIHVETQKKRKKSAIKPDFDTLIENKYEVPGKELSITVGVDVRDKRPVTLRFAASEFIHAFILGKSGSGKSVLLNDIITGLILKYSPKDLLLYLMDFKGVEFNTYRRVKHTKAVLVDSKDPQMTLEVLRELLAEDEKRRELFKQEEERTGVKVSDIDSYNKLHPDNRLPQILFVADECQVMFLPAATESGRLIAKEISNILVHIAKIGRSQGIHMLMATQQLNNTDIPSDIIDNLSECFLMMSAPSDSDRLVPDSSAKTSTQMVGIACYYHNKQLQNQVKTFYATSEELSAAIAAAQKKAKDIPGNGEYYFSGSSQFFLNDDEMARIESIQSKWPFVTIGHTIGLTDKLTLIPLKQDYSENILFLGENKEWQATSVAVNALKSLMSVAWKFGKMYNVKVIDCYDDPSAPYYPVLDDLESKGMCQLIARNESGAVLKQLATDVHNQEALPTILVVLGAERFAEMKRNLPLVSGAQTSSAFSIAKGVVDMNFFCDVDGKPSANTEQLAAEKEKYASIEEKPIVSTYTDAMQLILDEGAMQDVHVLAQVDKPANILFEEFASTTAAMFRHRVILRTANKNLIDLRLATDIDAENLSKEMSSIRAIYYPEDGDPQLFTPYILKK